MGSLLKVSISIEGSGKGAPLSMLIFVIFQNPLYIAIECSNSIRPIAIPGNHTKEIGYADDTNLIISDDESLIEAISKTQ